MSFVCTLASAPFKKIYIPLLFGDRVPVGDEKWQCYNSLLRFLDICTTHECSTDMVAYLTTLIEEHHSLFIENYPELKLTPKQHAVVHYPDQTLNFGPLIYL